MVLEKIINIFSYVIGPSNKKNLVFDTLDQAIIANPTAKPIFHSDRGPMEGF